MIGKLLLAAALVLVGGGAAASPQQVYERAACNRDNLFRCFIDQRYSVQASDFCSGLSPFTATVATTTATATRIVQVQVTLDAVISTETSTTTVFTETIPTATTTLTLGVGTVAKRQASATPPKCMTNGVTYPASRITSACSCIDVPATTVSLTHTVSTWTVTYTETSYTTPSATETVWATVSTATTGGVSTVTVGPPAPTNRIINGNFADGSDSGWELIPSTWVGEVSLWNVNTTPNPTWAYGVTGIADTTGRLRQVEPIYLESGRYQVGLVASLLKFPHSTADWGKYAVFDVVNPVKGTTITVPFPTNAVKEIISGNFGIRVEVRFDVSEDAAGWNEVAIRYPSAPPQAKIWGISLKRV
ncbi:hypothetical protein ACJ41O_011933 [Fusarium nematophilum]